MQWQTVVVGRPGRVVPTPDFTRTVKSGGGPFVRVGPARPGGSGTPNARNHLSCTWDEVWPPSGIRIGCWDFPRRRPRPTSPVPTGGCCVNTTPTPAPTTKPPIRRQTRTCNAFCPPTPGCATPNTAPPTTGPTAQRPDAMSGLRDRRRLQPSLPPRSASRSSCSALRRRGAHPRPGCG